MTSIHDSLLRTIKQKVSGEAHAPRRRSLGINRVTLVSLTRQELEELCRQYPENTISKRLQKALKGCKTQGPFRVNKVDIIAAMENAEVLTQATDNKNGTHNISKIIVTS